MYRYVLWIPNFKPQTMEVHENGPKGSGSGWHTIVTLWPSCFPGRLIRRTHQRLHHRQDHFPNRSLHSVLRSSDCTTTKPTNRPSSPSFAKFVDRGMVGPVHDSQIVFAIVADIVIDVTHYAVMARVCNPGIFRQLRVEMPLHKRLGILRYPLPPPVRPLLTHTNCPEPVPLVRSPITPKPSASSHNCDRLQSPGEKGPFPPRAGFFLPPPILFRMISVVFGHAFMVTLPKWGVIRKNNGRPLWGEVKLQSCPRPFFQ